MKQPQPTLSPAFVAHLHALHELHRLSIAGQDQTPVADTVRDALEGPWHAMTEAEQLRARGLSADLYTISDPPTAHKPALESMDFVRLQEATVARDRGEWDRALVLLRQGSNVAMPDFVSYLRGTIWERAGAPATALLFFEHALNLAPSNDNYLAMVIACQARVDLPAALPRALAVCKFAEAHRPSCVDCAFGVVAEAMIKGVMAASPAGWQSYIPVLETNLKRAAADSSSEASVGLIARTHGWLELCHERAGNKRAALAALDHGLRVKPNDALLLVRRGTLLYGESQRAVADFEAAVKLGADLIWPYYYLAHHYVRTHRTADCRRMCELALQKSPNARMESQLWEWLAIAQAEEGFSRDAILLSFDHAIRSDGTNESAKRNLAIFEQAKQDWETRAPSSLAVPDQQRQDLEQVVAFREAA